MRMLMSLNSQLDATTQNLIAPSRIRPTPKACWRSRSPPGRVRSRAPIRRPCEQQLTQLQGQLLQLQARYTDDYPDVIKTKADIAEVEKKLKEINSGQPPAPPTRARRQVPPNRRKSANSGCRFTSTRA